MNKNKTICLKPLYLQHLKEHDYLSDPAQLEVVARLQVVLDRLQSSQPKNTWLSRLKFKNRRDDHINMTQGLYLWGGVGRGKTYLVDFFYEVLPTDKKLRLHYYQFMQKVHSELKKL